MTSRLTVVALAATLLAAGPATAQDNDDWRFSLFNSSAATAIEFATVLQNGKWSGNWLSTPLKPAQTRPLHFNEESDDERCEIRTRIRFSDGSMFDLPINYCGLNKLVATDETLYRE